MIACKKCGRAADNETLRLCHSCIEEIISKARQVPVLEVRCYLRGCWTRNGMQLGPPRMVGVTKITQSIDALEQFEQLEQNGEFSTRALVACFESDLVEAYRELVRTLKVDKNRSGY